MNKSIIFGLLSVVLLFSFQVKADVDIKQIEFTDNKDYVHDEVIQLKFTPDAAYFLSSHNSTVWLSKEGLIREFGEAGYICEVYGHWWSDTTPNIIYTSNPPQYPDRTRKCRICGKEQRQINTRPKWVDE